MRPGSGRGIGHQPAPEPHGASGIRTLKVVGLDPRANRSDALGAVRGLAYSDDGSQLFAVTRTGEVLAYSTALDRMTIAQLDRLAAARVRAARAAGLYN